MKILTRSLAISGVVLLVAIPQLKAGQAPGSEDVPDIPISSHDRVYSCDQTSNTVSVYDPSTNRLLGVIRLGDPAPENLSPLSALLLEPERSGWGRKLVVILSFSSEAFSQGPLYTARFGSDHCTYLARRVDKMNLMATDQVTRGKRLKRFERMVRAYRVRPENGQWIVKKLGGKSRIFSAKEETLGVAKKKGSPARVG